MSIIAIHLHGYNVNDYRHTAGKMDEVFDAKGVRSFALVYHADTLREARKINRDTANRLAEFILTGQEEGHTVIVTAHSNGNTILRMAWDEYQASPSVAVCIQPALPSDINPSPDAEKVCVVWNPDDWVVRHGKILTWVLNKINPELVVSRNWGQMGRTGYTGNDLNVGSLNSMVGFPAKARGHSGIFKGAAAKVFLPYLADWAINEAIRIKQKTKIGDTINAIY